MPGSKRFITPLLWLHLSAAAFFVLLGWLSFSNIEYRFLHDGSLALFHIANYKQLFVPVQRLASVFNQFVPLLLAHTHAPLQTIALGFHINDVLWYFITYMVLVFLREWKFIPVLLIGYFATAGDNFFMISFEALLAWPLVVIFYALGLRNSFRQRLPKVWGAVLFMLSVPIIWGHPLLVFSFVAAGSYLFITEKLKWQDKAHRYTAICIVLLLVVRLFTLPLYDRELALPMAEYGVEGLRFSFIQTCI